MGQAQFNTYSCVQQPTTLQLFSCFFWDLKFPYPVDFDDRVYNQQGEKRSKGRAQSWIYTGFKKSF